MGRRVHTVRYGRGRTTWTECLETEVVGITGLTTYDWYGTVDHRHHHTMSPVILTSFQKCSQRT
jgi:hypothetical protein